MTYRPDIDGLRALAVVLVLLFHVNIQIFAGGFIGVDVFFVISGFLITGLIRKEIEQDRFTFRGFYLRRLRRLGPALVVVVLATLLAGSLLMAPELVVQLAESAVASLFSLANVYFWTQADYFDTEVILKPLQHMWSLGVEEQFYIVWPVAMLLIYRYAPRAMAAALIGSAIVSVVWAELRIDHAPSGVFYLPQYRIAEFALGAILALNGRWSKGPALGFGNWLSVFAAFLIVASALFYDEQTRFPGLTALIPCLGAALLIWVGPDAWVNRVLSSRVPNYIGRTSYSLYLVHWPLVVFFSYTQNATLGPVDQAGLLATSIVLGALMYHLVETPFRLREGQIFRLSNRILVTASAIGLVGITALATYVASSDGRILPIPKEIQAFEAARKAGANARNKQIRKGTCFHTRELGSKFFESFENCNAPINPGAIVVVGDSHAAGIWAAIKRANPDISVVQLNSAGCPLSRARNAIAWCDEFHDFAVEWIARNRSDIAGIIYSQRGKFLMYGDPEMAEALTLNHGAIDRLNESLLELSGLGVPVLFWGPRPEFHPRLPILLNQSSSIAELKAKLSAIDVSDFKELDVTLKAKFDGGPIRYLSFYDVICDPDCHPLRPDDGPLFYDYGHWVPAGGDHALALMAARFGGEFGRIGLFAPSGF